VLGLVAASVLGGATAASASGGAPKGAGWQRFQQEPFDYAAGQVCSFPVHADVARDEEFIRTLATNPDGTAKKVEITGPLDLLYHNLDNGKTFLANLSGTGWITYEADGTQSWFVVGPFSVSFFAGNPYHRQGEFLLDGVTVLIVPPDHNARVASHHGPAERSICAALS
jgi:hypothetical protein